MTQAAIKMHQSVEKILPVASPALLTLFSCQDHRIGPEHPTSTEEFE
jgi:hypothetical protein